MTNPASTHDAGPVLRCLSLGVGVQSSAVLLLACEGVIPRFDVTLFADTGWEPRAVYNNLARLRAHATKFGIPVRTVSAGNIRDDALDLAHRFVSMSLHVLNPDGSRGLARRQCTSEYKITPLKKAARELWGYPHPRRVPRGVYAEQAIGISTDEFTRAKDSGLRFLRNVFPLIDLGFDRTRCMEFLAERGIGETVKSASVGCPFHGNAGWRWVRDNDPDGWTEAVEFDRAFRHGYPHVTTQGQELRGQYFLHRSCRPLEQVDLDAPTKPRTTKHLRLITTDSADGAADVSADGVEEDGDPEGCSPWSCRTGEPVTATTSSTEHETPRACGMRVANTPRPQLAPAPPGRGRAAGSRYVASAAVAMIGYLLSVVAANIASVHWPPIVAAGLVVPAGMVLAGTSLTARDRVHDTLGARGVAAGIAAGAVLSAMFASPQIAAASVAAFTASEIVDALIYTRLRHRSLLGAVAVSNAGGLVVDSVLFVPLTFGSFTAMPGQIVGKTVATLLTLAALQITTVIVRWVVTRA